MNDSKKMSPTNIIAQNWDKYTTIVWFRIESITASFPIFSMSQGYNPWTLKGMVIKFCKGGESLECGFFEASPLIYHGPLRSRSSGLWVNEVPAAMKDWILFSEKSLTQNDMAKLLADNDSRQMVLRLPFHDALEIDEAEALRIPLLSRQTENESAENIIQRLNSLDKNELDAYERPELHKGFVVSGETNKLITKSKEELSKLGVQIEWNFHPSKKQYELKLYNIYSFTTPRNGDIDSSKIKKLHSGIKLGDIVNLLGHGWVHNTSGIGLLNWFFNDGSVLTIWPQEFSTDEVVRWERDGGRMRLVNQSKKSNFFLSSQNIKSYDSISKMQYESKLFEINKPISLHPDEFVVLPEGLKVKHEGYMEVFGNESARGFFLHLKVEQAGKKGTIIERIPLKQNAHQDWEQWTFTFLKCDTGGPLNSNLSTEFLVKRKQHVLKSVESTVEVRTIHFSHPAHNATMAATVVRLAHPFEKFYDASNIEVLKTIEPLQTATVIVEEYETPSYPGISGRILQVNVNNVMKYQDPSTPKNSYYSSLYYNKLFENISDDPNWRVFWLSHLATGLSITTQRGLEKYYLSSKGIDSIKYKIEFDKIYLIEVIIINQLEDELGRKGRIVKISDGTTVLYDETDFDFNKQLVPTDSATPLYPVPAKTKSWDSNGTQIIHGYINRQGTMKIEPQWDIAGEFREGFAVVRNQEWFTGDSWVPPNEKPTRYPYHLINTQGKIIATHDYIAPFSEGYSIVNDLIENKIVYSFIDSNGQIGSAIKFDNLKSFSEGLAPAVIEGDNNNKLWGYINPKGEMVIPQQFEDAEPFKEGLARVGVMNGNTKLWGFINVKGKIVIDPVYRNVDDCKEGWIAVTDPNLNVFFLDKNTNLPALDKKFSFASGFVNGYSAVSERNADNSVSYGYMDKTGKWLVKYKSPGSIFPAERMKGFHEGLAVVSEYKNGWIYYFINLKGEKVFNQEFTHASSYKNGLAMVEYMEKNQKCYAAIDRFGKTIWRGPIMD